MDKFYSTEEAAKLAGLKLVTFNQRARRNEIKPAEFVKSDDGGRPKARWTMAQIEEIKNLRGNKRTQTPVVEDTPQESAQGEPTEDNITVVDTVQAAAPIVEHAKDTSQIITLEERADRIRKLQADVQRGIIQIGFELIAAKNEIGHGGWSDWLATNFDWTQQTANRFMRVSERFGKLNNVVQFKPSTLQAMLALPEGDEQAFIAKQAESGKPLEKQSARQVQASVKQWKKKRAEETTTSDTIEEISEENSSETPVKAPITFNTQRGNCEYYTPRSYIEAARRVLGKIDLDPASSLLANETVKAEKIYTVEDDGLAQEWFGNIWLNPPYASGLIERFVDKLLSSNFQQAIVLVDNATETRWFRKLVDNCAALVFTTGRINFNLPDGKPINGSPTRGQVFLYFGTDTQKFFDEFQQFGWCSKPQRQLEILSLVESELGELQKNTTDDGGANGLN